MTGESEKKIKLPYGIFIGVGDKLSPCIIPMYVLSAKLCCTSSAVLPLDFCAAVVPRLRRNRALDHTEEWQGVISAAAKCLLVQQDPVERRVHHLGNWKLEVYFTGIGRYSMAVPTNLSPQSHSGFCAKFKDVFSGGQYLRFRFWLI
jgi:hypothetical protein